MKRLMKEARELKDPTTQYYAKPLEVRMYGARRHSCVVLGRYRNSLMCVWVYIV